MSSSSSSLSILQNQRKSKRLSFGGLSNSLQNRPKYALQKSKVQLCWSSLLLWELRISDHKMASKHHVTHQYLAYHKQPVQQSTFFGWVLTSCIRKLSSTHSRKLLHYFLSAELYFSWYLVSWSPTREQGLVIMRLLIASYRKFHLPLPPGWEVCNSCVSHSTISCGDNYMIIFSCTMVSNSSCLLPICIIVGGFQLGCWSQHPFGCLIALIPVWSFSSTSTIPNTSVTLVSLLFHRSPAPLQQKTKRPHQQPSLKYWCSVLRLTLSEFGFYPFSPSNPFKVLSLTHDNTFSLFGTGITCQSCNLHLNLTHLWETSDCGKALRARDLMRVSLGRINDV